MDSMPLWFERKFEFNFPVELHRNLRARLRGTPRLEEVLSEVSRNILIRKPQDKWSAQEHSGHLLDLESLWLARGSTTISQTGPTPHQLSSRTERRTKRITIPALLAKFSKNSANHDHDC